MYAGQISAQRCILEVKPYKSKYSAGVDAYIEEAVIRRELSDNYCFYNSNYDNIKGNYRFFNVKVSTQNRVKF
jgi:deoxyribodipyrimidine photo-lyase